MVAGLPKDPSECTSSINSPLALGFESTYQSARCPTSGPIASAQADASRSTVVGGFSLRGEARSIGI